MDRDGTRASHGGKDLLEAMSAAYFEATVDQLVERVATNTYDPRRAFDFFVSCDGESDRATPVLIFSFIENSIRDLFSAELNPDTPGGVDSLFQPFGPLATTSARIKMLAALEWISPKTARSLDAIRKIRNEFAHDPPKEGFANDRVRSLIGGMNPYEARLFEPKILEDLGLPPTDPSELSNRSLFIIRAAFTLSQLLSELLTAPGAIRMGLPPQAALARDRRKLPKNLIEVQSFPMRILLRTVFPGSVQDSDS